jgi:hypothetical protein
MPIAAPVAAISFGLLPSRTRRCSNQRALDALGPGVFARAGLNLPGANSALQSSSASPTRTPEPFFTKRSKAHFQNTHPS